MPDRCQQFEKHLDAWVAGTLDTDVRASLQSHVEDCERCEDAQSAGEDSVAASETGMALS